MICEHCGEELRLDDYLYVGNYAAYLNGRPDSGYKVTADVYKCDNEMCEAYQLRIEVRR